MDQDPTGDAARDALWLTLQLAGPALVAMLVIGLVVSIVQALTQIQEATLAFLPKLAALGIILMLLGPGMIGALRAYSETLFDRAIAIGGAP